MTVNSPTKKELTAQIVKEQEGFRKTINWERLLKHPLNVIPEMNDKTFGSLCRSIKRGWNPKNPIEIYQGKILDGWHRYRASVQVEVIPTFCSFSEDDVEAENYVMESITRRDLEPSQKACLALESSLWTSFLAQVARGETTKKDAIKELGSIYGVGKTTLGRVERAKLNFPDLYKKVKTGELSGRGLDGKIKKELAPNKPVNMAEEIFKSSFKGLQKRYEIEMVKEIQRRMDNNQACDPLLDINFEQWT